MKFNLNLLRQNVPSSRKRRLWWPGISALIVAIALILLFPAVGSFVRMAARSALHLWWLVLILLLGITLVVWGYWGGRQPKPNPRRENWRN